MDYTYIDDLVKAGKCDLESAGQGSLASIEPHLPGRRAQPANNDEDWL